MEYIVPCKIYAKLTHFELPFYSLFLKVSRKIRTIGTIRNTNSFKDGLVFFFKLLEIKNPKAAQYELT